MVAARLRSVPADPSDELDQIAARRSVLTAELAQLAAEESARVRGLVDGAARVKPVALTVRELAKDLRVAESTLRLWIRSGLPATRPGGHGDLMILTDDLSTWLRRFYIR